MPVAAAPGTLAYTTVPTPNPVYKQLVANGNVDHLVVAPDGTTMFAYDDTNTTLYKSSDVGVKWTATNIGVGLPTSAIVGMAISPNYATDLTIVVAPLTAVSRSVNGGVAFGEVNTGDLETELAALGSGSVITSLAVSPYFLGGGILAIMVGATATTADATTLTTPITLGATVTSIVVADTTGFSTTTIRVDSETFTCTAIASGTTLTVTSKVATAAHAAAAPVTQGGGVLLVRMDNWDWVDQGLSANVFAVAFSPNHQADAEILALGFNGTNTILTTKIGTHAFAADLADATIGTNTNAPSSACIAFAGDYDVWGMNRILVGTAGRAATMPATIGDDVYRVHGSTAASVAYDLNISGAATDTAIYSIAISGDIATADVLVGLQALPYVYRCTNPTASVITWLPCYKAPTGAANVIVIMAPDFAVSKTVYAGTTGPDNALSRSTDGGIFFNQLSLISVSGYTVTDITLVDSAIIDANTMFLLMTDLGSGTDSVFKTTDGGTSWERILCKADLGILAPSPDYATDSTIYVAETGTTGRLWKSTDGGNYFVAQATTLAVTALTVIDKDTYFTGHLNCIYKSGRWVPSLNLTGTVNSIELSPDYATDSTVFVGNLTGSVFMSTNDGVSFIPVGITSELGAGSSVILACDPNYESNKIIYAGANSATAADNGLYRWVVGTSIAWSHLDNDGTNLPLKATGLAIAEDGTLYITSEKADRGIRRVLYPTYPAGYFPTYAGVSSIAGATFTLPSAAMLENLAYLPGSNDLYAIASGITTPYYLNGYVLLVISDTMSIAPTLIAPEDETTVGTSVNLSWERISVPAGTIVSYTYDVAYDAAFANTVATYAATVGTAVTVTGLTPQTVNYS